jgi:hypothetical protein
MIHFVISSHDYLLLKESQTHPRRGKFSSRSLPTSFLTLVLNFILCGCIISIPLRVAWFAAFLVEWIYWLLHLLHLTKGSPGVCRQVLRLIGREVTVVDTKARRDIGYRGLVDTELG